MNNDIKLYEFSTYCLYCWSFQTWPYSAHFNNAGAR